jgi:DNA invertase Pin-like site-specific DNA recombinase
MSLRIAASVAGNSPRNRTSPGGKARLDRERVKKLADDGVRPAVIARELDIARSSVHRLLEEGRDHGKSRSNKRPAAAV